MRHIGASAKISLDAGQTGVKNNQILALYAAIVRLASVHERLQALEFRRLWQRIH
jgi:hypothetical protein